MIDRKELAPLLALMVVFASLVAVAAVNVTSDSGDSFTIIHTNDTHCFYDGDGGVGFPTVSALKDQYSRKGVVFTVDAGDFLQGNSYGTMTAGQGSVDADWPTWAGLVDFGYLEAFAVGQGDFFADFFTDNGATDW